MQRVRKTRDQYKETHEVAQPGTAQVSFVPHRTDPGRQPKETPAHETLFRSRC